MSKFNINWQVSRVKARKISIVHDKINHILRYLDDNKNIHDKDSISKEDILMVLNDLDKRKYKFRFNGKVPEDHKKFVIDLNDHLNCRY